jgi:hypothetical protein
MDVDELVEVPVVIQGVEGRICRSVFHLNLP